MPAQADGFKILNASDRLEAAPHDETSPKGPRADRDAVALANRAHSNTMNCPAGGAGSCSQSPGADD